MYLLALFTFEQHFLQFICLPFLLLSSIFYSLFACPFYFSAAFSTVYLLALFTFQQNENSINIVLQEDIARVLGILVLHVPIC